MTEKQMNIAIAESLGFEDIHFSPKKYYERRTAIDFHCLVGTHPDPDHNHPEDGLTYVPDYCNDLNAMHELEKIIKEPASYAGWLEAVTESEIAVGSLDPREIEGRVIRYRSLFWTAHATARQRAEAYLRTIGRFEDE